VILNKLLARFGWERKESRTWRSILTLGIGTPAWTPRDYEELAKAGYASNADVFACINIICGAAKQIPWLVYRKEGSTEVARNHPYLQLMRRPNPRMDGGEFIEACIAFQLISGNRYIERVGARNGSENEPPRELYPLRPDRMSVLKGTPAEPINGYEYKINAKPIRFEPWEILHQKLFNPLDDWYGMAPMEAAAWTVDIQNESSAYYKRLLERGYKPGVIMAEGDGWTDQQISDFKRHLRDRRERGDDLFLQGAKWQDMGLDPVQASLFEGYKWTKRNVAAIFRVPAEMLNDPDTKTYASYKEAHRSLYTEAVIPAVTSLRDGLNHWLSPLFGNAYLDFDKDAIDALAEDREVAAKRVTVLFEKAIIKRNEARNELKYDAVPEEEDGYYPDLVKPAGNSSDAEGSGQRDSLLRPDTRPDENAGEETPPRRSRRQESASLDTGYDLKAFNLLSEESKDNYWRSFESQRERWYRRVGSQVADRFDAERKQVLVAFRDGGEALAIRAVDRNEDDWERLYRSIYFSVGEDFARRVLSAFKSQLYDVKFEEDVFSQTVRNWLTTEGARRVVGVSQTTKDSIRRELAAGQALGESMFDLSKRLQSMYREFSNVRAERIARTETISASNLGSQTAAKSTGLPLEKEWISTFDNRVRSPHAAAHGQRRPVDEPYVVGGQRLRYPGDTSLGASADNTIQCRCTESYRVAR
jgi:HK97 family phage portal protein